MKASASGPAFPVSMATRALRQELSPTPTPPQPTPPLPLGRECALVIGGQVGGDDYSQAWADVTGCEIHNQVM